MPLSPAPIQQPIVVNGVISPVWVLWFQKVVAAVAAAGSGGGGGASVPNLFIQDTAPTASAPYLWIDTSGGNISFKVEV